MLTEEQRDAFASEIWTRGYTGMLKSIQIVNYIERAAIKSALEAAAKAVEQHDRRGRAWIPGSLWDTLAKEAAGRIRALTKEATQ